MAQDHENLDERLLHRMLFFTDAVFAIVMTLLVLEVRPPTADLSLPVVMELGSQFLAFGLSFVILGIFWIAHLSTTRRLLHFDWPTAIANLAFLLPVCLIPFGSAWTGRATLTPAPWIGYSLILIATSVTNMILVFVQTRGGGRLLAGGITGRERIYRLARASAAGLAFTVSLIMALTGHVHWSPVAPTLIPLLIVFFRLTIGRWAGA